MSDINDDLFALRVALQDNIFDESYIIRRLKEYLAQNNIPDEDINPTIINFYKKFGITIPDELVNNVEVNNLNLFNNINSLTNLLDNLTNSLNEANNIDSDDEIINEANQVSDEESEDDSDDESEVDSDDEVVLKSISGGLSLSVIV